MNVYRSSTTMQMDAKYKAVKQSRCMTRAITALRSPINKTVSSRCDPKPGSLTGDAVQFSVGRQTGNGLVGSIFRAGDKNQPAMVASPAGTPRSRVERMLAE
jgi:hypothetical protein